MIYDCFTFFNELDLLELRLNMLGDFVDVFVLVEADKTFTGRSKPLFFEENEEKFRNFLSRIKHVIVCDMPDSDNAWDLEYHQRDCIARGLVGTENDDLAIISDIDEIPSLFVLRDLTRESAIAWHLRQGPLCCEQENHYYFVNCRDTGNTWRGSVITRINGMQTPQTLRNMREDLPGISNGGWHFSYLGGVERIREKLDAFAETPVNIPRFNNPEHIRNCMESGQDLFGREEYRYGVVDLDAKKIHPHFALWLKKYPHYLYPGKSGRLP